MLCEDAGLAASDGHKDDHHQYSGKVNCKVHGSIIFGALKQAVDIIHWRARDMRYQGNSFHSFDATSRKLSMGSSGSLQRSPRAERLLAAKVPASSAHLASHQSRKISDRRSKRELIKIAETQGNPSSRKRV